MGKLENLPLILFNLKVFNIMLKIIEDCED